jgi:hypothetical protein
VAASLRASILNKNTYGVYVHINDAFYSTTPVCWAEN